MDIRVERGRGEAAQSALGALHERGRGDQGGQQEHGERDGQDAARLRLRARPAVGRQGRGGAIHIVRTKVD